MIKGFSIASSYVRSFVSIAAILLAWGILSGFNILNPLYLPSLPDFFKAFGTMLESANIYWDIWSTTYRAILGLIISIAIAVPLGLVFGRYPTIYDFIELPVDFFRSIPSSALFFLFILGFGVGDQSKVAVVIYGCALIILVGTIYGAKPTREKQDRVNMLVAFGASKLQVFYLSILRDALPHIAASIRVCVSLAFVLVIVTEMFLGAQDGLGHRLYDYYLAYKIPEMYCTLVILGLVGFAANRVSIWLEKKVGFWHIEAKI